MPAQPVALTFAGDSEVAYSPFSSGQTPPPDGRWGNHKGEMVLVSATVAGLQAGGLRYVRTKRLKGRADAIRQRARVRRAHALIGGYFATARGQCAKVVGIEP